MLNKLFKSVAVLALLLVSPAPLLAQGAADAPDDSVIYEYLPDESQSGDSTDGYSYEYTTTDLTDEEAAAVLSALAVFTGAWLLVALGILAVVYVYSSWALMVIGKKLGSQKAWMAWVPIVNLYYMFELSGLNPWLFLLSFIPVVNVIAFVVVMMKLSERRGFPAWLGLLLLLPVANIILPGYLAWAEPSATN